jgi:hypothetical protein
VSIILSGARDEYETVTEGTHNATLKGAQAYMKDAFDDDKPPVAALTLIWETEEEADDGDSNLAVFDSFLTLSVHERATLTKRLRPLTTHKDPRDWQIEIDLEDDKNLSDLPHWRNDKIRVTSIRLNDVELFGTKAMIGVSHNDNGYARVDSVVAAPKAKGKGRREAP